MGKDRLSNLALLYIHYDFCVDLDKVVDSGIVRVLPTL